VALTVHSNRVLSLRHLALVDNFSRNIVFASMPVLVVAGKEGEKARERERRDFISFSLGGIKRAHIDNLALRDPCAKGYVFVIQKQYTRIIIHRPLCRRLIGTNKNYLLHFANCQKNSAACSRNDLHCPFLEAQRAPLLAAEETSSRWIQR
jgi:hypothetical protein